MNIIPIVLAIPCPELDIQNATYVKRHLLFGEMETVTCNHAFGYATVTGNINFNVSCSWNQTHTYLKNLQQCRGNGTY